MVNLSLMLCYIDVVKIVFTMYTRITYFAIAINSNVCPHIRVPNMLMRGSYVWHHRNI